MSAHPSLGELGDRLKAIRLLSIGHNLSRLGADLCTEGPALYVLRELVALAEEAVRLRARVRELEAALREEAR